MSERNPDFTCQYCQYFVSNKDVPGIGDAWKDSGECRKNAPVIVEKETAWPWVKPLQWCSQWKWAGM